jgi:hypothetical protein
MKTRQLLLAAAAVGAALGFPVTSLEVTQERLQMSPRTTVGVNFQTNSLLAH